MSFSKSMGLVLTALVVVGLTLAVNDRVFWTRWFSQPPGDTVLTAWHWYQPVEVIGDGPGTLRAVYLFFKKASGMKRALAMADNDEGTALV